MFAYCDNNPVNREDESGYWSLRTQSINMTDGGGGGPFIATKEEEEILNDIADHGHSAYGGINKRVSTVSIEKGTYTHTFWKDKTQDWELHLLFAPFEFALNLIENPIASAFASDLYSDLKTDTEASYSLVISSEPYETYTVRSKGIQYYPVKNTWCIYEETTVYAKVYNSHNGVDYQYVVIAWGEKQYWPG